MTKKKVKKIPLIIQTIQKVTAVEIIKSTASEKFKAIGGKDIYTSENDFDTIDIDITFSNGKVYALDLYPPSSVKGNKIKTKISGFKTKCR